MRGHALRLTGVRFDAVRMYSVPGTHTAERYAALAGPDADLGPVVCEALGFHWMYFLLPPCTVKDFRWPSMARALGGGTSTVAYVGVPAVDGETWPLRWYAPPTSSAPFVDPSLLNRAAWLASPPPSRHG